MNLAKFHIEKTTRKSSCQSRTTTSTDSAKTVSRQCVLLDVFTDTMKGGVRTTVNEYWCCSNRILTCYDSLVLVVQQPIRSIRNASMGIAFGCGHASCIDYRLYNVRVERALLCL